MPLTASELAAILRCPVSGSPLRVVPENEGAELREAIRAGHRIYRNGGSVRVEFEAAFASMQSEHVYLQTDGIIALLPDLAVVSQSLTDRPDASAHIKENMARFYDLYGWQKNDQHTYNDAAYFEDLRPVSEQYRRDCHLRVSRHIPQRGRFLLDAASGPLQYPEYLTYSAGYAYRICADISSTALREARRKLGDRGIYLQCDVTCLPLQDGIADGVISLHTIYHVPEDQQSQAVAELQRVLAPGGSAVIVYRQYNLPIPWRIHVLLKKLGKWLRRNAPGPAAFPQEQSKLLYFYAYRQPWRAFGLKDYRIFVWRSVTTDFLHTWIPNNIIGRLLLALIYRFEEVLPGWWGEHCPYPLIVIDKPRPE